MLTSSSRTPTFCLPSCPTPGAPLLPSKGGQKQRTNETRSPGSTERKNYIDFRAAACFPPSCSTHLLTPFFSVVDSCVDAASPAIIDTYGRRSHSDECFHSLCPLSPAGRPPSPFFVSIDRRRFLRARPQDTRNRKLKQHRVESARTPAETSEECVPSIGSFYIDNSENFPTGSNFSPALFSPARRHRQPP